MAKTFLVLISKIWKSFEIFLGRTLSSTTKNICCYDDITLKTYLEVANTGNYTLLKKPGSKAEAQDCENAWHAILKKNGEKTGDLSFFSYIQDCKALLDIREEYTILRACLMLLMYKADMEIIEKLIDLGYRLDISSTHAYHLSLQRVSSQAGNLLTQMISKEKEMTRGTKKKVEPISYEELVADLNQRLGFATEKDITLAAYNRYNKVLKQKHNGRNKQE